MIKKLMYLLCALVITQQGIGQSHESAHLYAQIYDQNNELVSSLSLDKNAAKEFKFEEYINDNKRVNRMSVTQIINTELVIDKYIYRTFKSTTGDYLCKSVEVSAVPALGVVVSSTNDFHGVRVEKVTQGGPASKLGIQIGDILYNFNNTELSSRCDLQMAVRQSAIGSEVPIHYTTRGKSINNDITVGAKTVNTHTYTFCDSEELKVESQPIDIIGSLETYPNPTRRSSFINYKSEADTPVTFSIIDMNGSIIHIENHNYFSGELRLEYVFQAASTPGIYLFVVEQDQKKYYSKVLFVKE